MELITNFAMQLQIYEIPINQMVQQSFRATEFFWVGLSTHFSPAQIMDVIVPLVGAFHHQLLVRLVCSLGVINTLNSLLKWSYPEYRPYWWVREFPEVLNHSTTSYAPLRQHYLTCETTAGLPSSHAMTFTAFVQLLIIFIATACFRRLNISFKHLEPFCFLFVALASICMWLSRIYLACQFLHQCILGSLVAVVLLHLFDHYAEFFYTFSCRASMGVVSATGLLPIGVYFAMLYGGYDPHWSVRMAFKWCMDPSYLRHEASPIFVLARDFGYLMGVAVSAPLYKRYESNPSLVKRLPAVLLVELINWLARLSLPKQSGRFVFVAYEFLRNACHSYTLLSVISKIP